MKGFAHVEFTNKEGVEKAMLRAGEKLDGREIKVDVSESRKKDGNCNINN